MITDKFKACCELARQETSANHHTDSLLIISYHMLALGPDCAKRAGQISVSLEAIKTIHEAYGYMLPNLGYLRNTIAAANDY